MCVCVCVCVCVRKANWWAWYREVRDFETVTIEKQLKYAIVLHRIRVAINLFPE